MTYSAWTDSRSQAAHEPEAPNFFATDDELDEQSVYESAQEAESAMHRMVRCAQELVIGDFDEDEREKCQRALAANAREVLEALRDAGFVLQGAQQ